MKKLQYKTSSLLIGLISTVAFNAHAFDGSIPIGDCPSVTIRVDDISTAVGWGSHFSRGPRENGFGGGNFECHLTGGRNRNKNVQALCYDGVLNDPSSSNRTNIFRFNLGPRHQIDFVEWHLGEFGVGVSAQLKTKSIYTEKRIPYLINSYFPIHPDIGLCGKDNFDTTDTLYWKINGNLANRRGRRGSGYSIAVTTP